MLICASLSPRRNPFTITGYSGMDPERPMLDGTTDSSGSAINTGIDNVAYPNPRTFLFGIDFLILILDYP